MFDFPSSPTTGTVVTGANGAQYLFDGTKWTALGLPGGGGGGGGASVTVADNAPLSPHVGDLWFDSISTQLYLWYTDPNSSAWVMAINQAALGINDAPDTTLYARQKGLWTALPLQADAPDDGYAYARQSLAWARVLPLTGGTLTGGLTVQPTAVEWAQITLDKVAGQSCVLLGSLGGNGRWWIELGNAVAENGGNTGSDFCINRDDDSGSYLDTPLMITRSTGITIFNYHGISFGSASASAAADLSRHVDLYGGAYGFSITDGSLNIMSDGDNIVGITKAAMYIGAGPYHDPLRLSSSSGYFCRAIYTVQGVRSWSAGIATDGTFVIADESAGSYDVVIGTDGAIDQRRGMGIKYTGIGANNWHSFNWNGPNAGVVNVYVDNGNVIQGLQPVSDARMKTDIKPADYDCLAAVLKLPLHAFRWKDAADPKAMRDAKPRPDGLYYPVGFVAQELNKVYPQGVVRGDESEDVIGRTWTIEQNIMLATLTGAIQQLAQDVERLHRQHQEHRSWWQRHV